VGSYCPGADTHSQEQHSGRPGLTVVIPTYNERNNLRPIVCEILELLPGTHVVVVDDGSPDGTGEVADALAIDTGAVTVLHRTNKTGIGPAYIAGFRSALARETALVAAMDADGSHSARDLLRMITAAESADLVLGSRYVPGGQTYGWPLWRRLLSRSGGRYARVVLGVPVTDLTSGFKVYQREALVRLALDQITSDGYAFQIETTWQMIKQGMNVLEVPIVFRDRIAGKSKLSRMIVIEAAVVVWRLRFRRC